MVEVLTIVQIVKKDRIMKIGITGTIASGKTSVSILLRRHGFLVFNSDQYAKSARYKGNDVCEKIIAKFGESYRDKSGDIDAKKLADLIFSNEQARIFVNDLMFPYVINGMNKFFESHSKDKFIFAEVPLLFEANIKDMFDRILVVTCSKEIAIKRMMEDRQYTEEEANLRYDSQYDPSYQIEHADDVLYNNGTLKDLNADLNLYLKKLRRR